MPWRIERDGSTLRVQIACPIDDWEILFEEIDDPAVVDVTALSDEPGPPEIVGGQSSLAYTVLVVTVGVVANSNVSSNRWSQVPTLRRHGGRPPSSA